MIKLGEKKERENNLWGPFTESEEHESTEIKPDKWSWWATTSAPMKTSWWRRRPFQSCFYHHVPLPLSDLMGRRMGWANHQGDFFYFLYFSFLFLKKYIFVFEIYRNIPGRPTAGRPGPGRPAAGRQGLFCKKFRWEFALRPLEDRSPGSGAAGPQAARQRGDRLPEATGPRLLHQKFRKKLSVCRNTIHIIYNGLTVHWYCKSVLALQGSINKVWVQNMKTKTTGP